MRLLASFLFAICLISGTAASMPPPPPDYPVKLGFTGDDEPGYVWCRRDWHKMAQGQNLTLFANGRNTANIPYTGRLQLTLESGTVFNWIDRLISDPTRPVDASEPYSQPVVVPAVRDFITYPNSSSKPGLTIKPTAPLGLMQLDYRATDPAGAAVSDRARGCLIDIVEKLPDVTGDALTVVPTCASAATFEVRFRVRNMATGASSTAAAVPWRVVATRPGGGPGANITAVATAEGAVIGLAPGATRPVTVMLTIPPARLGARFVATGAQVSVAIDPDNVVGENPMERSNNAITAVPVTPNTIAGTSACVAPTPPTPPSCGAGFALADWPGGHPACFRAPPCRWIGDRVLGRCEDFQCTKDNECTPDPSTGVGAVCPMSGPRKGKCSIGYRL